MNRQQPVPNGPPPSSLSQPHLPERQSPFALGAPPDPHISSTIAPPASYPRSFRRRKPRIEPTTLRASDAPREREKTGQRVARKRRGGGNKKAEQNLSRDLRPRENTSAASAEAKHRDSYRALENASLPSAPQEGVAWGKGRGQGLFP